MDTERGGNGKDNMAKEMTDDQLDQVAAGSGNLHIYYLVEGYTQYNEHISKTFENYHEALIMCKQYGLSESCIKEVISFDHH